MQRHLFASCSPGARHALPDHALFTAERGERCVPLMACWPELLGDCAELGPVAIVGQNSGAQLARCISEPDFAPVPMSTEIVELRSGFVADTVEWSHALAVEEPTSGGSLFSLQFFGHDGAGLWKLLLTRDAQLEHFAGLVRHYASGTTPPAVDPDDDGTMGCGRGGVRSADANAANEVAIDALLSTFLEARRTGVPLTVTVGREGLVLTSAFVPRSLERCSCALHAYDHNAELHVAIGDGIHVHRIERRRRTELEVLGKCGKIVARVE
jgi:putative heme degradation protein